MIVATGTGGQFGRGVVEGLLARVPADRVVATVRGPAKARALADRGVDVRAGDFAAPDGLAAAFAGAGQLLVVSVDPLGVAAGQVVPAGGEAGEAAEGVEHHGSRGSAGGGRSHTALLAPAGPHNPP